MAIATFGMSLDFYEMNTGGEKIPGSKGVQSSEENVRKEIDIDGTPDRAIFQSNRQICASETLGT